jgi:hypothetical protein
VSDKPVEIPGDPRRAFDTPELDRPALIAFSDGETVVVSDVPSVEERFRILGITRDSGPTVLPRNIFHSDNPAVLVFEDEAQSIRILARRAGIDMALASPLPDQNLIQEHDDTLIAPVIHFFLPWLQTADAALLVTNFLTELHRYIEARNPAAKRGEPVRLDVVVSRGSESRKVSYRGPASGLTSLADVLRATFDGR